MCGLGEVEDEVHFLLNCYVYDRERGKLFNDIKNRTSRRYDFNLMRYDSSWMLNALIGTSVGNSEVAS